MVVAGKTIAYLRARPSVDDYTPGGRSASHPDHRGALAGRSHILM
jgi:hypothetical protein